MEWANIVFTSAISGQRVRRVLDAVTAAAQEHCRRVTTATINLVLRDAVGWRAPPSTGSGKRGRIYYATQVCCLSGRVCFGVCVHVWVCVGWCAEAGAGGVGVWGAFKCAGHSTEGLLAECLLCRSGLVGQLALPATYPRIPIQPQPANDTHPHPPSSTYPPQHHPNLPARPALPWQAGIKPPTFVLFVNDPSLFPDDYKKYIERQLRENIGFPGSPLRLYWRGKAGGWGRGGGT